MKRATTPDTEPTKRAKTQHTSVPVLFDHVPEQCPKDIMQNGVDEDKWITGKFKMLWPPMNGRKETLVSANSGTSTSGVVFSVFFELDEKDLARLTISPLNEFRLSLKGAQVIASKKSNLSTLPLHLVFSRDVYIMWKPQGGDLDIKTLNTWQESKLQRSLDNTWYNSEEEATEQGTFPLFSTKSYTSEPEPAAQADTETLAAEIAKQSKKRQRADAKRLKKEALASSTTTNYDHNDADGSSTMAKPLTNIRNEEPLPTVEKLLSSPSENGQTEPFRLNPHDSTFLESPNSPANNELHINGLPGLATSRYQPISSIRSGQIAQLSGIVVGVSENVKKASSDEWMCFVKIADPSCSRSNGTGKWKGLKINCFTKRYKEWLPFLRYGDAVILRDVKIEPYFEHLTGVGHHYRLRWVAYSPSVGEIYHGPPNDAPKYENLADGFGAEFSPFYDPDSVDIKHLVSLSDWWRELAEKDKADSVLPSQKIQIGRLHRVISETGPDVPPNGYFDCTVEILKVFLGAQGIHSLFVTDYTPSPGSSHSSKLWPTSLNECVLQMEMFDDAARLAETLMKPGEYYSIKNARIRINRNGYLEGKVVEGKIFQLEESDAKNNIYLTSLLQRKKVWEDKETNADLDSFQLVQEAEEAKFFDCMVELLQVVVMPNRMPCLYVTDYSGKSSLSVTDINEPWSNGLDGRIIQIMLSDEQKNIADSAVIGTFWSVRKIRLKYNKVEERYCGILGGGEKLIVPLNINRTDNDRLNDLLKRKEIWRKTFRKSQHPVLSAHTGLPIFPSGPEIQNKQAVVYTHIRDIPLQTAGSARHQLIAKVVDFYPLELKDAFYQSCSSCKKEIPSNRRACSICDDFEHEYVKYCYQMFILIEDRAGDQIKVSINDKCPLLAGLKRAHLGEDSETLKEFTGRVKPLVGDLIAMHHGLKAGKTVHVNTPLLCFEIDTWIIPVSTRAFSLSTYDLRVT